MSEEKVNRRDFIKTGAIAGSAVLATGAALSPLKNLDKEKLNVKEFIQKHYHQLSDDEMQSILKDISLDVKKRYGVDANVKDIKPKENVAFAYALNLEKCIGCRRCVHACAKENNNSRNPEIQYIRVLKMPQGTMDLEQSEHDYDDASVPEQGSYYMPIQCHQCKDPACVKACPVKATWKEQDGVVVVDYNWCIGCRYCVAACPYWARRFNYREPNVPADQINPNMNYLSNRPRPKGVVEKCTFCLHRTREGKLPACQEVCPVGARVFGNVMDKNSAISNVLKNKRVYILKEELGARPRFYYFFDK